MTRLGIVCDLPAGAVVFDVSWRPSVQPIELELSLGDVLHIGEHVVTVVEIHDDEVTFKIVDSTNVNGDEPVLRPR